jgi:hypothetical protein
MLFAQVKFLAYCIFATVISCLISPGIYVIRNRQVRLDVLAAYSSNPDANVIGKPLPPGSDSLVKWRIEISSGLNTIENVETGTFLSNNGGKAVLAAEPFLWRIESQDSGFLAFLTDDSRFYLSHKPSSNSDSVTVAPFDRSYSQWTFTF